MVMHIKVWWLISMTVVAIYTMVRRIIVLSLIRMRRRFDSSQRNIFFLFKNMTCNWNYAIELLHQTLLFFISKIVLYLENWLMEFDLLLNSWLVHEKNQNIGYTFIQRMNVNTWKKLEDYMEKGNEIIEIES